MKKITSVLLSVILLLSTVALTTFAGKDEDKTEVTEFVLDIDVNERYTDFVDDTDGFVDATIEKKEMSESQKTIYIAVLVSALVVSVVVLAVSIKRVPDEADIDISGEEKPKKKRRKGKEE